jgi:hypothetical protein
MSTRQRRVHDRSRIAESLAASAGRKIQIVLNNQTVFLAKVVRFDGGKLTAINMRLKTIVIPVDEIDEIYLDTKE